MSGLRLTFAFVTGRAFALDALRPDAPLGTALDTVAAATGLQAGHLLAPFRAGVPLDPARSAGAQGVPSGATVHVLVRLLGGKGGFGSNLKNAGKKQKGAVTNFDACRDLSGRRIRHVTQQRQLEGWTPGQPADPRLAAHELSKKELGALDRRERERAAERREEEEAAEGARRPTHGAGEARQRAAEDAVAKVAQKTAELRKGTQEAVAEGLARQRRPNAGATRDAAASSSSSEDDAAEGAPGRARACSAVAPPAKRPKVAVGLGLELSGSDSDSD